VLANIASEHRDGVPCRYEDKFFNMVRRINSDDGVSCVVRLRLPDEDTFAGREALTGVQAMEIEVASMKLFGSVRPRHFCVPPPPSCSPGSRSKTSIPVHRV
jgi:hypothetical protein